MRPINYLIIVSGATGTGKTETGIFLARHFNTEIISADSRQFYKELNIGTAKPGTEQLRQAKHHFINSLSIFDNYNMGLFEKDAISQLNEIFQKNKVALLVGGSGLYIKAVCEGIDEYPEADKKIREKLKKLYTEKGIEALQNELSESDPSYFVKVDKSNPHRLIRALEVCLTTGKPFSSFQSSQKKNRNFIPLKIGLALARNELYQRIDQRVDAMIAAGLVEEVKNLRKLIQHRQIRPNALETVGYQELFNYLEGTTSLEQATQLIKQHTRNYAKRQLTWFRKEKDIRWFHPDEKEKILEYLRSRIL